MNELPWFERDLTFGKTTDLLPYFLERLEGTIVRIEFKLKDIDDRLASTRFEGKWSIKENIGHLAEVDQVSNRRLDEMINGISVLSPAVLEPQDYNPWSIDKLISHFRTIRKQNIKKYLGLSPDELTRSSMHPRLKKSMTPVDLAWFDAEHDDHHLVKVNFILKQHFTHSAL